MKKGLSLPIEVIVIVAIAVLVLVVVAAFFANSVGGSTTEINRRNALNTACQILRTSYNCDVRQVGSIEVNYADVGESQPQAHRMTDICNKLGFTTNSQCAQQCGCSAGSTPSATASPAATSSPAGTP